MNALFTVPVAFRCHFALKTALLTGKFGSCATSAVYPYHPVHRSIILPVSGVEPPPDFRVVVFLLLKSRTKRRQRSIPPPFFLFHKKSTNCNYFLLSTFGIRGQTKLTKVSYFTAFSSSAPPLRLNKNAR